MTLNEKYPGFDEYALVAEPDANDPSPEPEEVIWLWGYGEYEESSVLAGQHRQARLERYNTREEAEKDTGLKVDAGSTPLSEDMIPVMPTSAPAWFDPMDAGEAWGEDDY